jgi:hypothetical protein
LIFKIYLFFMAPPIHSLVSKLGSSFPNSLLIVFPRYKASGAAGQKTCFDSSAVHVLAVMVAATVTAAGGGGSGGWVTVIVGVVVYVTAAELLLLQLLFRADGRRCRGSRRGRSRRDGGRRRSGSGSGNR